MSWRISEPIKTWEENNAKTITFILTENCQLRCRYCYVTGKNEYRRLDFSIAKKVVDYITSEPDLFDGKAVIWDFIGGEPLLEIELMDKICDYIKLRLYETDHKWFENYRINISTNGLLYNQDAVQEFIKKNHRHLSIGLTIDGTPEKHDLNRVYPNGRGSYDDVVKNVPLWLKQFPESPTKVTISSEDLLYLKDSIIHLYELGIKNINANVVFEDVWNQGDTDIYEEQLMLLADYIIEHELYKDLKCSLFSQTIGKPINPQNIHNWCGAGKMLAIDCVGNFFPCLRFAKFSLQHKKPRMIGNYSTGLDLNKVRPFMVLNRITQSPAQCLNCNIASGCAWCQGVNYDFADTDTIFQRATFICEMHQARVRANNYFWHRLSRVEPEVS